MRTIGLAILTSWIASGCNSIHLENLNRQTSQFELEDLKPIPAISCELLRVDF